MNFINRHLANLLLGLVLGVSLALGPGVVAQRDEEGLLPLAALRTFTEIFATLKTDYVEPAVGQRDSGHGVGARSPLRLSHTGGVRGA